LLHRLVGKKNLDSYVPIYLALFVKLRLGSSQYPPIFGLIVCPHSLEVITTNEQINPPRDLLVYSATVAWVSIQLYIGYSLNYIT